MNPYNAYALDQMRYLIKGMATHKNMTWQKIQEENLTKRERFLKAGGSFDKKFQQIVHVKKGSKILLNLENDACQTYYDGPLTVIFDASPPYEKKQNNLHLEKIFANQSSIEWHTTNGRVIKISELADKHLVNIMRYLVAHWEEAQKHWLEISRNYQAIQDKYLGIFDVQVNNTVKSVNMARNATQFWESAICLAKSLWLEFFARFGYDSLNSILEGN